MGGRQRPALTHDNLTIGDVGYPGTDSRADERRGERHGRRTYAEPPSGPADAQAAPDRTAGPGQWRPATWDEALDRAAAGFAKLSDPTKQFGMFSCSKASNETNFLAQKFVRSVIGSNNIDSCNRT